MGTTETVGASSPGEHIPELDGLRGLSIALVLLAHLAPLGPHDWDLNFSFGLYGMSLFFTLSGYLITGFLWARPEPFPFLVRRLFRIVPLAWTTLVVLAFVLGRSLFSLWPDFYFVQNYFTSGVVLATSHFWSLSLEVQFYAAVALLVLVFGRRGLLALPVFMLVVTATRFHYSSLHDIRTHLRIDEILAGATLSLLRLGALGFRPDLRRVPTSLAAVLLFFCSSQWLGPTLYLRPYAGALLVGATLVQPESNFARLMRSRSLRYLATHSYALYVFHGPLRAGIFEDASKLTKYLVKRPLTLLFTFSLAHLSTKYFEARFIELAKRWTSRPPGVSSPSSKLAE